MTVEDLIDNLKRAIRLGTISEQDSVSFRDLSISDGAMEAGSNGYTEVEEILYPRDGRVLFLGEDFG